MTVLRAEIRILADDRVLAAETVTIDDDQPQPWMWFMSNIIDVAKRAHTRFRPGFGEATPPKKADVKPWEQMEFDKGAAS
jgi:hypothetical protein